MKLNHFLLYLEWLKIEKERKWERYLRLTEAVSSPGSSLNTDGLPHGTGTDAREVMLVESSMAFDEFNDVDTRFYAYREWLLSIFSKLDHTDRTVLEELYVWNLDLPIEKRGYALWETLRLRKSDRPAMIRQAKNNLRSLLLEQGCEVE